MTVLIVDDHGSFRTAARKLLEHHGYRVVGEACDGESALAAVRELRPDVVLLDVQMPGIDGFEVASRLNAIGKPPEVVFVSSRPRKLSEIQGDDSMILTLARGHYCRKEHQQHLELAANYPGSSCTASTTATGSGGARRSPISGTTYAMPVARSVPTGTSARPGCARPGTRARYAG
ncbi:MAG: response regulator transcription factor [Thermoleophilaceae bacterium]